MTPKKLAKRRARIAALNRELKKLFPRARIELVFNNPLELLVAVQLSAQCTDKMVNRITETLFKKYRTLEDYVRARPSVFAQDIRQSGFFRSKARNILGAMRMIQKEFGGRVPRTMPELLRLPGVARKTANVVLAEGFGVVDGVTVDTHVIRFVSRFELSDYTDPKKIETDLMRLLPKKEWRHFTQRVIHYGRYMAPARKYDTSKDPLVAVYPKAAAVFKRAKRRTGRAI